MTIDPARYKKWRVTLQTEENIVVSTQLFDVEDEARRLMAVEGQLRRYPRRSLESEFFSPACSLCNVTMLSDQDVNFRLWFGCDDLICDNCYKKRRRDFRLAAPVIADTMKLFSEYHEWWLASSVKGFSDKAASIPDIPGVYSIAMPVVVDGACRTATYIGLLSVM